MGIECDEDGIVKYNISNNASLYSGKSNIRTIHPLPASSNYFYFEVEILGSEGEGCIEIGLVTKDTQENRLLSESSSCIGYTNVNSSAKFKGTITYGGERTYTGERLDFSKDDVIGFELRRVLYGNIVLNLARFSKNGRFVGPVTLLSNGEYYPAIAFNYRPAKVKTNLGESSFHYEKKGNHITSVYVAQC